MKKCLVLVRVAEDFLLVGDNHSFFHQGLHGVVGRAAFLEQQRDGDGAGRVIQEGEDGGLVWCAPFHVREFLLAHGMHEAREQLRLVADLGLADHLRQHRAQCRFERAAIVIGDPFCDADQLGVHRGLAGGHVQDGADAFHVRVAEQLYDRGERGAIAHGHADPRADLDFRFQGVGDFVIERRAAGAVDHHSRIARHAHSMGIPAQI